MGDITKFKIGSRVKCVYDNSIFYGRVGTVIGFEHDGWIRIVWDGHGKERVSHPNDLELIEEVKDE